MRITEQDSLYNNPQKMSFLENMFLFMNALFEKHPKVK